MRNSSRGCKILLFSPDEDLAIDFKNAGLEVSWIPLIKLVPKRGVSLTVLDALRECRVVAFTSPRAISMLVDDAKNHGVHDILLDMLRSSVIGVVGPKTQKAVREYIQREPDLLAPESYSLSLAATIAEKGYRCVVAPRSAAGVRDFAEELLRRGVKLYEIPVYEPLVIQESIGTIKTLLTDSEKHLLVLTSPMIAELVCSILLEIGYKRPWIVAIGATTAKMIASKCPSDSIVYVGDGKPSTLIEVTKKVIEHELESR